MKVKNDDKKNYDKLWSYVVVDDCEGFKKSLEKFPIKSHYYVNLAIQAYEFNAYDIFDYLANEYNDEYKHVGWVYERENNGYEKEDESDNYGKEIYIKAFILQMMLWEYKNISRANNMKAAKRVMMVSKNYKEKENLLKLYRDGTVFYDDDYRQYFNEYKNGRTQCQRKVNIIAVCSDIIMNEWKCEEYEEKLINIYEIIEYIFSKKILHMKTICEKHIHHNTHHDIDFEKEIYLDKIIEDLNKFFETNKLFKNMESEEGKRLKNIAMNIEKLFERVEK